MKLVFGILLLSTCCYAQKVSLHLTGVSLAEAFSSVETQAGVFFAYRPGTLSAEKNISINVNDVELTDVLSLILKNSNLTYSIKGKLVAISPIPVSAPEPIFKPVLQKITGKVVDVQNEVMVAVNVMIKGTTTGTTTDSKGIFLLNAMETDVLVFSFIGYKPQEVIVGTHTAIDVTLLEDMQSLNEVKISGGYYETTDLKKTGSIVKVTAKDIEHQPVTSPLLSLQGRMSGVDISPLSGNAGSSPSIVIRGRNSISTSTRLTPPLYIIDGIPINSLSLKTENQNVVPEGFDPLNMINPANIESIEVLKDADATAIYGSRGANGVVLVTTKRGSGSEKTHVDLTFYSGAGKIPYFLDRLNTPDYVALRKEGLRNENKPVDVANARDLVLWDTTRYTNWQEVLLGGSSKIIDVQASISGGNASTNFRFGASYHKEGTIYPGEFGYQRIAGNFSLNHTSDNKKFTAALTTNYGIEINKLFTGFDLVGTALELPPNAPAIYDANGDLNWENSSFNNPFAAFERTDTNHGSNLILNSTLGYEFFKGLNLRLNTGYNTLYRSAITKTSPFSAMDPATITSATTATAVFSTNIRSAWIIEPQVTYHKQVKNLELNVLAGATAQQSGAAYQVIRATGYSSDAQLESLKGATQTSYTTDDDSQYRYMAIFGRLSFDWKQKYLINLTGRRDGSSRFGPERRWGNFGSVGAAWIISEEQFMQKVSFLSLGKIRGSYGVTGSDAVGDYEYISTYDYTPYVYQGKTNLTPSGLANNEYGWEQTVKLETALELGFLKDRIRIETAFYRNRCSSQLLQYQLPGIAGFTSVRQNLDATLQNTGLEFALNTININHGAFQWRSSFNLTLPRNKLISYPDIENSPYNGKPTGSQGGTTYIVGKPLNIIATYNYEGVDPTTGFYKVTDVDANGIYDYRDRTVIQKTGRLSYGGFSNTFRYKGIELSFLFQFSKQISSSGSSIFLRPGFNVNTSQAVLGNHWKEEGDITSYQKAATPASTEAFNAATRANFSNAAYANSSFIRLQTLSLSYSLSSSLLRKVAMNGVKIFLQGQNLYTLTSFTQLDPNVSSASASPLPSLRMITVGIEIKL